MNELFRFSVIRPITKSGAKGISIVEPAPVQNIAKPPPTLQSSLGALAAALGPNATKQAVWDRMEPIAAGYISTVVAALVADPLWTDLAEFLDELLKLVDPAAAQAPAAADIAGVFANHATLTPQVLPAFRNRLADLFLASLIVRRAGPARLAELLKGHGVPISTLPELTDITNRLASCDLAAAGQAPLASVIVGAASARDALKAAINKAISVTLLIPASVASVQKRPQINAGFRELQVVKQHIRRYEAVEVARIENVLKGELRDAHRRHTLSTEQDTFSQSVDSSETNKELDSDDRTSIKNEADSQVKDDTKLDGGVHAQYSGPSFKLQTDLTASYQHSDDQTKKYSAELAKDIVQKVASKVSTQVTRSQTTKIIEQYEEREQQKFGNEKGGANIVGVYQWIEKVYLAQTFNLGRHLLVDMMVPEPAANLLAMAGASASLQPPPIQPQPLGTIQTDAAGNPALDLYGRMQLKAALNPLDLSPKAFNAAMLPDPGFYGNWVALYGATSVDPPPEEQKSFSQSKSFDYEDDTDKAGSETLTIDDGYVGATVVVSVSAMRNDNPGNGPIAQNVYVDVSIGGVTVHIPWQDQQRGNALSGSLPLGPAVSGSVGFTIYGRNINQMTVNVEIVCNRTQLRLDQWKLQTYEKIAAAYRTLQQTYDAAIAGRQMAARAAGIFSGTSEDANRLTERTEIKRTCVAILDADNATVGGLPVMKLNPAVVAQADPKAPQLPEPDLSLVDQVGARVRWFEQAFEWENMAYVLYPYYWGRRDSWLSRFSLTNGDPLFLNFLQAGYARVVVPVRLGFEAAMQFYLTTGLPWMGGDVPLVGDETGNPLYLDVAEEIRALTDGGEEGETEMAIGDPWEYPLPTTVVKLRDDSSLPEWHRNGPDGKEAATFPSNAPPDAWTWRDGAPTI